MWSHFQLLFNQNQILLEHVLIIFWWKHNGYNLKKKIKNNNFFDRYHSIIFIFLNNFMNIFCVLYSISYIWMQSFSEFHIFRLPSVIIFKRSSAMFEKNKEVVKWNNIWVWVRKNYSLYYFYQNKIKICSKFVYKSS